MIIVFTTPRRNIKPFLALPAEIRIMIYKELLILSREDESGEKAVLHFGSMSKEQFETWTQLSYVGRTSYVVPGRQWTHSHEDKRKRKDEEYKTTYYCLETLPPPLRALHPARPHDRLCGGSEPLPPNDNDARRLHAGIISTNKVIAREASEVLYQNHIFDFGNNYAAGEVFFQDHFRCTSFLRDISFQKHIMPSTVNDNYHCNPSLAKESRFWAGFYWAMVLANFRIKKLHIHLIGDTVPNSYTGPRTLSKQVLDFLLTVQAPGTEWIIELARLRGSVEELVIVESRHPDLSNVNRFLRPNGGPQRKWNLEKFYDLLAATMAGSISSSVAACLREGLGV
jgi:hypothetical protein